MSEGWFRKGNWRPRRFWGVLSTRLWKELEVGRLRLAVSTHPGVFCVGLNAGHVRRHCWRVVLDIGPIGLLALWYYKTKRQKGVRL
jgi:hypothetical protein